jgi:hypothetical protein
MRSWIRPLIGAILSITAAMISAFSWSGTVKTVHILTLFFGGAAAGITLSKAITGFKNRT